MLKRILGIGIAVILVAVIVWFFVNERMESNKINEVYDAIPLNAVMLIETNHFQDLNRKLLKESPYWGELKAFPNVEKLDNYWTKLDSLIAYKSSLKSLIKNRKLCLSLHPLSKNKLEFLLSFNVYTRSERKMLHAFIKEQLKLEEIPSRNYEGSDVFSINLNKKKFFYTIKNGVCIWTTNEVLLEESIRQIDQEESITQIDNFRTVQASAGKQSVANIFLRYSEEALLTGHIFKQAAKKQMRSLSKMGTWLALDLKMAKNSIQLLGLSFSGSKQSDWAHMLLGQSPVEMRIIESLPKETSLFTWYGISDKAKYQQSRKLFMEAHGNFESTERNKSKFEKKYKLKLDQLFNLFDSELVEFYLSYDRNSKTQAAIAGIRTKGQEKAREVLNNYQRNIAQKNGKTVESLQEEYKLDEESSYTIHHVGDKNLLSLCFPYVFGNLKANYYCFFDNYVFFSESKRKLKRLIKSQVLHQSLDKDLAYNDFAENNSSQINYYQYIAVNVWASELADYFKHEKKKDTKLRDMLAKIPSLSCQLNAENNKLFVNINSIYSNQTKEQPQTIWESLLDAEIDFKPQLIVNHYTKEKEIFVQDRNNTVYLLNKVGRIMWKMRLDEPIMSEVQQVDYYRNGKLQLLFSTQNKIHLLDRNGNYVERYPIKLRSKATNGVAVFDYEGNRKYRLFIATENRKVYAYNLKGNIVKGWGFKKSEFEVTKPIQHFRIGTKDYIVFADKYRSYILNRKGQRRVKLDEHFPRSMNNTFVLDNTNGADKARLVSTDSTGKVHYIYLNGKTKSLRVEDYSANHFFDFKDVDADGRKDFIFTDGKSVEVYSQTKKLIFKNRFEENIEHPAAYYHFGARDRKIGVVCEKLNQLYLFNKDGSMYEGFPLQGSTMFSIGYLENSSNNFNLIVGNRDKFLYNYSVR